MDRDDDQARVVLVAVDDDEASERVVEFVNRFFGGLDVTVIGINVGQAPDPPVPLGPGIRTPFWPVGTSGIAVTNPTDAPLDDAAAAVAASGLASDEAIVDVGDPVVRICRAAEERAVDLIVIGDNHRGAWHRLMQGDVTTGLRRRAHCPVLVVP